MPIGLSRVGPYELIGLLGAGGMGEVYRARDSRLGRDVALKILSSTAAVDPARQQRLLREARAASALNHPNILAVYDVGTEQGVTFIVSELVDGTSLRERMEHGPVPVRELLELAVQIGDGLAAAHEAGIVHRDLKPENVMVTRDGRVKLVDFGLARMQEAERGGEVGGEVNGDVASVRSTRTDAALIVGTVPYMSPEQARGVAVDFRSDQFSLGLMLYELATGQAAFKRETPVETLAAIINEEPRPSGDVNPKVPVALRWVIERCLAKEPRRRYAATPDLAHDLRTLRDRLAEATSTALAIAGPTPPPWRAAAIPALCLLLGVVIGGFAIAIGGFAVFAPSGANLGSYRLTPLGTDPGYQGDPAWSPDGKTIAYVAEVDGVVQVFTRSLSSSMRAKITDARFHCRDPFWSPDGTRIFYISLARDKEGLWSVSAAGGTPEVVVENVKQAAISPDGKTLAFTREEFYQGSDYETLWLSSPPDAEPHKYERPPFGTQGYSDVELRFSPDGSKLGIWAARFTTSQKTQDGMRFWIIPMSAEAPHRTPESISYLPGNLIPFGWLPDSRHIVSAVAHQRSPGTHLWLLDTMSATAQPLTVSGANENRPAVSPDGAMIAFASEQADFDLIEVPLDGSPMRPLLATSRNELEPAWSPVANRYAFVTDRTGKQQIWIRSADGIWEQPLVTEHDFNDDPTYFFSEPAFSPDGQRIAYARNGREGTKVFISMLAGGSPVRLAGGFDFQDAPTWSPDGNWVAYTYATGGHWALMKAMPGTNEPPVVIKQDVKPLARPLWSPRGDWIACETDAGLSLVSADGKMTRPLSEDAWLVYGWAADGTHLYGIKPSDDRRHLSLASMDIQTANQRVLTPNLGPLPISAQPVRGFSRMSDKSFATSIVRVTSEVWLLEGFRRQLGFFDRLWPMSRLSR